MNTLMNFFKDEKPVLGDKANLFILGKSGSGKAHHPWDCLNTCSCGERPLLMNKDNELYSCGSGTRYVFAVCPNCGKSTKIADMATVIKDWNQT